MALAGAGGAASQIVGGNRWICPATGSGVSKIATSGNQPYNQR